jgi:tellurite resistance protein
MAIDPIRRRPKAYPAPEFPPHKPKLFARTPPAVFAVVLGLLGLGLALRKGLAVLGLDGGVAEALMGALLGLWLFATAALLAKTLRRPGVVIEDLRVLPGRAGLAAATMSAMAAAAGLVPYAPRLAFGVLVLALVLHAVLAVVLVRLLITQPAAARAVDPSWHLSFVGFIVAAVPAAQLGYTGIAAALLWLTLPIAVLIWGASLVQLFTRIPPAPLRPLLAIHLSPAALFTSVAALLGYSAWAQGFAALGAVILLALLVQARWIMAAGRSPLWGAFTFPLAAYASALLGLGGAWADAGILVLIAAIGAVPPIAYWVLKGWTSGQLAQRTNAAEA